jgi:hypothetical protein
MISSLLNNSLSVQPSRLSEIVSSIASECSLSNTEERQLYSAVKHLPEDILCAAYVHLRRRHFASLHFLLAALHEFIAPELLHRSNHHQEV